jgi:hypothetical protein
MRNQSTVGNWLLSVVMLALGCALIAYAFGFLGGPLDDSRVTFESHAARTVK